MAGLPVHDGFGSGTKKISRGRKRHSRGKRK